MIKLLLVALSLNVLTSFLGDNKLVGKWESPPSPKGNITIVHFKADGSFEGFVNRKPFVSGHYAVEKDLLKFTDNGCDGRQGAYQLVFSNYGDSLRFRPLEDSCGERKEGMSKLVVGRKRIGGNE